MSKLAILIGTLLGILGIVGYVVTGSQAPTALIPSILGTLLIILGLVARRYPEFSKQAMHTAAALAALGFLGGIGRAIPALSRGTSSQQATPGTPGHMGMNSDQFSSPVPAGSPGHLGGLEHLGTLDHGHLVAFWTQTTMAILSLAFLIFCIKSFMEAREQKGTNSYPYNRVP